MPSKTRKYYLATSSSPLSTGLSSGAAARTQALQTKTAAAAPSLGVPEARSRKMPSVQEEAKQASATGTAAATKSKSEPAGPKKPRSKQPAPKKAGPWSDWYVSDDQSYFWRARQLPNETWDYQLTPGDQQAATRPETTPNSPKSSWPTIATTSTGQATEISACDDSTQTTLPRELDEGNQPHATETGFVSLAVPTQASQRSGRKRTRRPMGPVMRLLQEARGRKSGAQTKATKSYARDSLLRLGNPDGHPFQQYLDQDPGLDGNHQEHAHPGWSSGAVAPSSTPKTSVLAKKLHARVRSEKDLRSDPKRKVKTWLKGVAVDRAPIPLDEKGLPVYH